MIKITTREEYDFCTARGFEPLVDTKNFVLDISLRIEIQKEIFGHRTHGRGNIPQANERFFRWVWEHKPHICEETMQPLHNYSAVHCSHILTRGAYPEMAHDPRNINILCFEAHNKWENGKRETMRIFTKNEKIIKALKKEYQQYALRKKGQTAAT